MLTGVQLDLFDQTPMYFDASEWAPPELPSLAGVNEVIVDVESDGLRWWGNHRPIGLAIGTLDGQRWYFPFRHAGGNLPEERVKEWALRELRGKRIIAFNSQFDVLMLYAWGVDLEAMGCTVTDVGHHCALLDDHRLSYSLDNISLDVLGVGKIKGLDKTKLKLYHAKDVSGYAMRDIELTCRLFHKFAPQLVAQGLTAVRALEDECIFVTCEMMRNGSPIDEAKLDLWLRTSQDEFVKCLWEIHKLTGITKFNPRSRVDKERLFKKLGIPLPLNTQKGHKDEGKVTFAKEKLAAIKHPAIHALYRATRLSSLRSKYLLKYKQELALNGCIRYSLHQLPVDDEGGTVSGRYSSSGFGTKEDDGCNIQQVAGKKHLNSVKGEEDLASYIVRELFVPASGLWFSADADQIEYRLFAHYAKPPRVLAAYAKDPHTDFHNIVMDMIREVLSDITRETTKDTNFAYLYGAGLEKISSMLGLKPAEAQRFLTNYNRAFPEARRLRKQASDIAEKRGYVRSILGRRTRFINSHRIHKALNGVIQPSAADVMKLKLVELHKERKYTGLVLRFTVHDEVNGDVPDKESAKRVAEILNRQSVETRVPLLWGCGTGSNWQEAKAA